MSRPQPATVESAATSRAASPVRNRTSAAGNASESNEETESVSFHGAYQTSKWFRLVTMDIVLKALPSLDYHHLMMIIAGLQILFISVVLGGCTLEGLRGLHIASFKESPSVIRSNLMFNQSLPEMILEEVRQIRMEQEFNVKEVRLGYFTMCVTTYRGQHYCGIQSPGSRGIADLSDPLGLINAAHRFRTGAITPGLLIIALVLSAVYIFLISRFPNWRETEDSDGSERWVKPFPSRTNLWFSIVAATMSTILLYVGIMWQQVGVAAAAVAMKGFRYGLVETGTGTAAAVLGWISVGLAGVAAMGIIVLMISIMMLTAMV